MFLFQPSHCCFVRRALCALFCVKDRTVHVLSRTALRAALRIHIPGATYVSSIPNADGTYCSCLGRLLLCIGPSVKWDMTGIHIRFLKIPKQFVVKWNLWFNGWHAFARFRFRVRSFDPEIGCHLRPSGRNLPRYFKSGIGPIIPHSFHLSFTAVLPLDYIGFS